MKTKRPQKSKGSPKKTHLVLIAFGIAIALLALGITIYSSFERMQREQTILREDVTFGRIETYINTVKLILEQELPGGGWKIYKRCEAPGSKGSFDEYTCIYGVIATNDLGDTDALKQIAQKITGNKNIYVYPDHPSFAFDTVFEPKLPKSCVFYSWEENSRPLAIVQCDSRSIITRYELRE